MALGGSGSWAARLRAHAGCEDALAGVGLQTAAGQAGYESSLLSVPGFLQAHVARQWFHELASIAHRDAVFIGRSPETPSTFVDPLPWRYRTAQYFREK
eukprot:5096585-Pyramimonas_sp.AAC.1